jgi:HSP20 family protein
MKLRILSITMLPALAFGYSVRGYDAFGRPVTLRGIKTQCQPAAQVFRGQQQQQQQMRDVDQAFEALRNDLQQEVSGEEMISKSKEWIDRSFNLFSELNRDVALTEDEAKKQEEMLEKQKKWANKVVDFADEFGKDISVTVPKQGGQRQGVSNDRKQDPASNDGVVIPPSSIKDDETAFKVEMELPGVKISDIDIRVNEETETLVISAQRQALGSDDVTKYSKSFGLVDPTIDTDKITASLKDGILLVTAPKKPKKSNVQAKQIPVKAGE